MRKESVVTIDGRKLELNDDYGYDYDERIKWLYEELESIKLQKYKKHNRLLIIFTVLAPFPVIVSYLSDLSSSYQIVSYGLTGVMIVGIILQYLQPSSDLKINSSIATDEFRDELYGLNIKNSQIAQQNQLLKNQIDSIVEKIQKGEGSDKLFSEEDRENILKRIEEKLENKGIDDYKSQIIRLVKKEHSSKKYDQVYNETTSRLVSEVQNQSKRGNINLILGISTTLTGVVILSYSVFNSPDVNSYVAFVTDFIPKLSLVLLIEVFAYFFLSLYRQSLIEIKYFQNELTNIESKYLAIKLINNENSDLLKHTVESLLGTERNFILNKGQSTVEIEREKLSQQKSNQVIDIIDSKLNKFKYQK